MREYKFCPHCSLKLSLSGDYLTCPDTSSCGFIHWNNPTTAVAAVVPMPHSFLLPANIPVDNIPDGGILLVQRGTEPFRGKWCLPCGHVDEYGDPQTEVERENHSESGILVRVEQILPAYHPVREANRIIIPYLARPVGGELRAGDDAADVGVFSPDNLPDICFASHRTLVQWWFQGKLGALTGVDLVQPI